MELQENRSALREAAEVVEHRRARYGSPKTNFSRIASFWHTALAHKLLPGQTITMTDVAQLMRLVKEARLIETPDHRDSLVDICGYVDCHEQVLPQQLELGFEAGNEDRPLARKFKVGDRVRHVPSGEVGVIVEVQEDDPLWPYAVKIENGPRWWYRGDKLELVESEAA